MQLSAFSVRNEHFGKRAWYNKCSDEVSADEANDDADGNLVGPLWCHAQIEEKNAYFHSTVGDQSMEGQASLRKPYPKETVVNITNA